MIRFSGFQWQIRTRGLTRHLSQEGKEYQDAKHHFRKARKTNFEGCADDRKCMQETSRMYETMDSRDEAASGPQNNPQCDAAKAKSLEKTNRILRKRLQRRNEAVKKR